MTCAPLEVVLLRSALLIARRAFADAYLPDGSPRSGLQAALGETLDAIDALQAALLQLDHESAESPFDDLPF